MEQEKGTVKTSAIVIATGRKTRVYRRMEDVPPSLRRKLMKSTEGSNAGTVLIADRRGAEELMRAQRVLEQSLSRQGAGAAVRVRLRRAAFRLLRFAVLYWSELLLCGVLVLLLWLLLAAAR